MTKEIGILMSPPMVMAGLEGRKTQTRRTTGLKEINKEPSIWNLVVKQADDEGRWWFSTDEAHGQRMLFIKPRYQVGDRLYWKEMHYKYGYWKLTPRGWEFNPNHDFWVWFPDNKPPGLYVCKGHGDYGWYKRPGIFMFAKDARIHSTVLAVEAQRVQDITLEDCWDEGIDIVPAYNRIDAYHKLWDLINGDGSWKSNPWVWKITIGKKVGCSECLKLSRGCFVSKEER